MAAKRKPDRRFGMVPLRAAADDRLSGAHFKVLIARAYHDRGGENGMGDWSKPETTARETGLHYTTVSTATNELVKFGYLIERPNPFDRRRHSYSLNYKETSEVVSETRNYPTRDDPQDKEVAETSNESAEIVCLETRQDLENVERGVEQYIPRRGREKREPPPPANTESAAARDCVPTGKQSRGDSAVQTEEKNARAREEKFGGDDDATRRARLCLGGTHAAGGDDSTVESEEKKEREMKKEREAKKSREALASKAGKDHSEFDDVTWCAWLNLTYGYDRNAAADLIRSWDSFCESDCDRVKRALCEAHTCKPTDVQLFMAKLLCAPGS